VKERVKEFYEEHKLAVAVVVSSLVTAVLVREYYEATHVEVKTLNAYLLKKFAETGGDFRNDSGHYNYPQFHKVK
jgi:hypothetical protein